jgi:hypothetical protein
MEPCVVAVTTSPVQVALRASMRMKFWALLPDTET